MIHFKLKEFDKITPVGREPNLYLSWYWLTEGDLWLTFGDATIYEYSRDAMHYFGNKPTPYNDYYIVRFLEDFTTCFEKISQNIPNEFYQLTEDITQFKSDVQSWLNLYETDDEVYSDFYFEEYDKLISWLQYERTFSSAHLIGGPKLYFFRNKEKIRIVWESEYNLENGISLWTAKDGSFEMTYLDFVNEVRQFGQNFFNAMDLQIEQTLSKEWEAILVDKEKLVEEHRERKMEFNENLQFLEHDSADIIDWTEIEKLYQRMKKEIQHL
ncbi:DUF5984 family protein [Flavobacterium sp. J27]|uniref:DUF5984 family protein n=1 Tax=Flavobacterium sp. J27 TaxID=2060419 RepID=UPI0010315E03|nr:DUF5984 family protein [Flavobacterium sp. J27]